MEGTAAREPGRPGAAADTTQDATAAREHSRAEAVDSAPGATAAGERLDAGRPGNFQVTDAGIFWTCARCASAQPLERDVCDVCGATFAELVKEPERVRPQRDANNAALYSLFLPGAGHAYLGLWPQAIARAMISIWVLIVVVVAALQRGVSGSLLIAIVFGVAAFALWAAAAHDAYREARGEHRAVLLKGRTFVYVVLGLLLLLIVLMLPAIFQVRGR